MAGGTSIKLSPSSRTRCLCSLSRRMTICSTAASTASSLSSLCSKTCAQKKPDDRPAGAAPPGWLAEAGRSLTPELLPPHSQPRALGYSPRSLREQDAPRCDSIAQEGPGPRPSSRGGRSPRVKAGARSGPLRTLALREASGEAAEGPLGRLAFDGAARLAR